MKKQTRRILFVLAGLAVVAVGAAGVWYKMRRPTASTRGKKAEHHALLRLMPADLATHVAVADGPWSDEATWSSGTVPGEGAIVHVPPGKTVTYEGASPAHLFMVRVCGTLRLQAPNGGRTSMIVDTLFTTGKSTLAVEAADPGDGTIDIEVRPFDIEAWERDGAPAWGSAAKEFYSDGAVVTDTGAGTRRPENHVVVDDGPGVLGRYEWDPAQLSLGIITHGAARVRGQAKLSKSKIERTARKGDESILLADDPGGWAVGDRIVITGTHYVGRDLSTGGYLGTEDEIREVARIDGREIGIDRPLEFDHDTPRDDLKAHAANLTRNVRIHSAIDHDLEQLDADVVGATASRLGHVMFMHNEDVTVSYAAFDDLGRSNKNETLDDLLRTSEGEWDGLNSGRKGVRRRLRFRTPSNEMTNPRGRYAVHLHRTGATADDGVALIEGAVVTGGPGWGFVSHDSRADFRNNVTYGVLGTGYVAETGNETGTWEGNIAINTYGADFNSPVLGPRGTYRYENDDYVQTILLEKRGSWKNQDFGHFGDGFWFQGKLIDVKDNVSVSSGLMGYFYMFRSPDQIYVRPEVMRNPESAHSPKGVHPSAPGLTIFVGNESIADRGGLAMIGLDGGRASDERSVIEDFTAWEVGQIGTHAQYYPGYTIKDSTFLASTSPRANPTSGLHFLKMTIDVVLANLEVEGFPLAYDLRKSWSPGTRNLAGFVDPYEIIEEAKAKGEPNPLPLGYAFVLIDPGFTREEAPQNQNMGATYRDEDIIMTSDELELGRFKVELDDESLRINLDYKDIQLGWLPDDPIRPSLQEGYVLMLSGTKTDSIGSIPINYHNNQLVWLEDAVQHRLETVGYYHMPNGKKGLVLEELFSDRYTAERHVIRFVAELDPRQDLSKATDLGRFDATEHPDVYVPAFFQTY